MLPPSIEDRVWMLIKIERDKAAKIHLTPNFSELSNPLRMCDT